MKLPATKRDKQPLRKFQLKERVSNNRSDVYKEKARMKNERKYNNEVQ